MRLATLTIVALLQLNNSSAPAPEREGRSLRASETANADLFRALRHNDPGAIRAALARGADANGRNEDHDTPLMCAAVYSTAESLHMLLEHGADPNLRDRRGGTALMRAVRDLNMVRTLLAAGAAVDAKSESGVRALMVAANRPGSSPVVRLLLRHHADPIAPDAAGVPPLMYAVDLGDLENAKALVEAGAPIDKGRSNGVTALVWAASGPFDVLAWLLEHGANPNATRTVDRYTPLMEAAFYGRYDNAEILLDWGADVNAGAERGTPLIWAAGSDLGSAKLIRLLLDRGADPTAIAKRCERCISEPRAEDGSADLTALMLAKQRGDTAIVQMLIAAGATR